MRMIFPYSFSDGYTICHHLSDDPDYSEEDYLNDYVNFMTDLGTEDDDGWVLIVRDTIKVTLGGNEYLRMEVDNDYQGKTKIFYYARKIDDNLMCVVQLMLTSGKTPEEFEKLFV